jgi:hypothetical protein
MVIQLLSGKIVEISVEQYLNMSDDDFIAEMEEVVSYNYGEYVEDPFFRSAIFGTPEKKEEDNEHEPSLDELGSLDKLRDLDITLSED